MSKKLTTEQFIARARAVHGDKYTIIDDSGAAHKCGYDYSKANYTGIHNRVEILCPIHGSFFQEPNNHIVGRGCPMCGDISRRSKRPLARGRFIEKAVSVHGNKYSYDNVAYKNNHTKVCIVCPIHGEFWQTPGNHIMGHGCPICAGFGKTTQDFIRAAKSVHGDRWSYGNTEYVNAKTVVCIICPKHGEFWQRPEVHLRGGGCPACGVESRADVKRLTQNQFIERSIAIHGGYDYSGVEYINALTKVCITCPEHGDFWQTPAAHLSGQGCPKCNRSRLEGTVESTLESMGVRYIPQYRAQWLGLQSLDFYLPEHKIGIECQGIQHYQPVGHFGGEDGYQDCIKRDKLKAQRCKDVGVGLVYIKYDQDPQIILKEALRI